jgi:DNA-directed RNA polymerase specialized sigma subunit
MLPQNNKPIKKGMPSILGDTPAPFSAPNPTAAGKNFAAIHQEWKTNQTPEYNSKILKEVQPIIDTAVSSYGGGSATPAFKTRAKLMALKAMQNFDPAKGNVRTHLLSQLQSLRRLAAQEQNVISIPEQVGLDFQKLTEAENALRDKFSREPNDDEVADFTGLSTRRIKKIRMFHKPIAEGSTVIATADDYADSGATASKIPGQHAEQDAWADFVYGDLDATNKLIMDMSLGRNGRKKLSVQEIARKLNVTPGAVSQRAAKIQAMLDQRGI